MVANADLVQVVDPYVLADPAMIPDLEQPRIFDIHARLDGRSFSHLGSKKAKQENLEFAGRIEGVNEKKRVNEIPYRAHKGRFSGIIPGVVVLGQVCLHPVFQIMNSGKYNKTLFQLSIVVSLRGD